MGKPTYTLGQEFEVIEYITASRKVFTGRCVVTSVHVSCDGAAGSCLVYDDPGGSANLKINLQAITNMTSQFRPWKGVLFQNGIYVTLENSTSLTMITYIPLEKLTYRGE